MPDAVLSLSWRERLARRAMTQAETDVVLHRLPRHEGIVLKHHATVGTGLGDGNAVLLDTASARLVQPGDHVENGGFSAA